MNLALLGGTTWLILACLAAGAAALLFMLGWGQRFVQWLYRHYQGRVEHIHGLLEHIHGQASVRLCRWMVFAPTLVTGAVMLSLAWRLGPAAAFVFGLGGAYLGSRLASVFAKWLHWRWLRQIEDQLVDCLTLISNGLRSGLSLPQALTLVQKEMPPPLSREIKEVLDETLLGGHIEQALEKLAERVPSQDLGMAINAVSILRETGGNLSETFDTIVATVVERKKVEGKIRSLTSQGVAQGVILIAMPFVLAYVLNLLNPDYMRPLFNTLIGWIMLLFMVLMLAAGGLMIRKIVKIDV